MGNDKEYTIRLPSVLLDRIKLIPVGRRSSFIRESLETALNFQDQTVARLTREIEEEEKKLNIKKGLLNKLQISQEKKELQENEDKRQYEWLCDYLKSYTHGYNTDRFNKKFNLNISGFPEFEKLQEDCLKGDFTFEQYKALKIGGDK